MFRKALLSLSALSLAGGISTGIYYSLKQNSSEKLEEVHNTAPITKEVVHKTEENQVTSSIVVATEGDTKDSSEIKIFPPMDFKSLFDSGSGESCDMTTLTQASASKSIYEDSDMLDWLKSDNLSYYFWL